MLTQSRRTVRKDGHTDPQTKPSQLTQKLGVADGQENVNYMGVCVYVCVSCSVLSDSL